MNYNWVYCYLFIYLPVLNNIKNYLNNYKLFKNKLKLLLIPSFAKSKINSVHRVTSKKQKHTKPKPKLKLQQSENAKVNECELF